MQQCSSCHADLIWAATPAGKRMPLDAKAEKRFILQGSVAVMVDTYVSHFATCPNADQFRRSKEHEQKHDR